MEKILKPIMEGKALSREQAYCAMEALMDGQLTEAQIAALLSALRARGETLDEVVGFAQAMRERSVKVDVGRQPLLDTCGTGGDGSGSFNVSTTAAFIAAGAGVVVAKHGNRSVSSRCGSADVLEALGVKTDIPPETAAWCVRDAGVGFLFAPSHHPGVRNAAAARKRLGGRTVFNLLGPLSNPAGAKRQVLGVYSASVVKLMAQALKELGSEEAMVVSSRDGLDELSLSSKTAVARLKGGEITEFEVDGQALGLPAYPKEAISGGDAAFNAQILRAVLEGKPGAPRDVSVLNAAAGLVVAGKAADLKAGIALAQAAIDEGKALAALEALKRASHA